MSVIGTGIGIYFGQGEVARLQTAAGLTADTASLDFGTVDAQRNFSWKLPIRNLGNAPVQVFDVVASCACTRVAPRQFIVKPGETISLAVQLNLMPRTPEESVEFERDFRVQVLPQFSPGTATGHGWTIAGRVKNIFRCSPPLIDFGEELIRGQTFPSRTVAVTSREPFESLRAECRDGRVELTVEQQSRKEFRLHIKPLETVAATTLDVDVLLNGIRTNGQKSEDFYLQVIGKVVPDVRCVPPVVLFTNRAGDDWNRAVVSLVSRSGQPFLVESMSVSDPSFEVDLIGSGASAVEHILSVKCHPDAPLGRRGTLQCQLRGQAALDVPAFPYTVTMHVLP